MAVPPRRLARIALVEDDASLRSALSFALEADGYEVADHADATHMLAATADFDCLVVDLRLPDLDGLSLIGRLRQRGMRRPAILITSHPDERCRAQSAAVGAEIVEKPLIGAELRQRIAQLTS